MSEAPWLGDTCSLVDAFRSGERTPLDELDASLAAIDRSELNAFSFVDAEAAREGGGARRRARAVRWCPRRREGARFGRRLAVYAGECAAEGRSGDARLVARDQVA